MKRWLLAAGGAAALLLLRLNAPPPPDAVNTLQYVRAGRLLHDRTLPGPALNPSYRLPLTTVPSVALESPAAARALGLLLALGAGLLLASLAGSLGDPRQALAAAGLLALGGHAAVGLAEYPQGLYTVCVLAVAAAAAARARAPSPATAAALAAALGASLLCRSPLTLLPPLLFAAERLASRGRRPPLRESLLVLAGPFLFLAPWIAANFVLHGRLVLYEDASGADNIAAGALGLVGSFEGDGQSLLPAGVPLNDNFAVLRWALGEMAAHPWRALEAFVRRLAWMLSQAPATAALAAASAWAGRADPARRVLALVAAYFAAVHCAFAVQENYFLPFWPLAAALGAGLLGRGAPRPEALAPARRAAAWAAGALAAAALASAGVVGRYAAAVGRLPESPAAGPGAGLCPDSVLEAAALAKAGRRAQAAARLAEAAREMRAKARVRGPQDARAREALARLSSTRGFYTGTVPECWDAPPAALAAALAAAAPDDYWALLLRARLELDAGRAPGVLLDRLLARARAADEREALAPMLEQLVGLLARGGRSGEALELLGRLPRVAGSRLWRWEVELALARGEHARAEAAAAAAPRPTRPEPFLPHLLGAAARAGRPELVLALAARARDPLPPDAALDAAEAEVALGRAARAAPRLAALASAPLTPAQRRRAAGAAEKAEEHALARRLLAPLLEAGEGGDWLAAARLDARLSGAGAGLDALAKAEGLALSPAQRRAAALQLQAAGRPADAAERLGRLSAAAPRDAGLKADHGVALFLAGRREEGAAALAAAARLPDAPPAVFLSLSRARAALGDAPGAEAARAEGARRCRGAEGPCGALR